MLVLGVPPQGMSSEVAEVRGLVGALAKKLEESETELDAQAIANALYGMQSMRCVQWAGRYQFPLENCYMCEWRARVELGTVD